MSGEVRGQSTRRGYEIVFAVPVTALIEDDVEFSDGVGDLFEGPAFDAMQRVLDDALSRCTKEWPGEDWTVGELSIDGRTMSGDEIEFEERSRA